MMEYKPKIVINMVLYIVSFLQFCQCNIINVNAVVWHVKPYIFFNEATNKTEGSIIDAFAMTKSECIDKNQNVVNYLNIQKEFKSLADFDALFTGPENYTTGNLTNFTQSMTIWIPGIKEYSKETLKRRGMTDKTLFYAPKIAVVVKKTQIALFTKLSRGILNTQHILVMSVICAIVFAILIWVVERWNNPEFGKSFTFGFGTGLWWAFVTMTTVGYGDIVPRSFIGRCITVVWMIIGLVSASLMTAAVSDVVLGVDYLDLRHETVAAIKDSYEAHAITTNYKSKIIGCSSYEEVLEKVEKSEAFAGILTTDIAGYMSNDIYDKNLVIPRKIDIKVPVKILEPPAIFRLDDMLMKCFTTYLTLGFEEAERKYKKFVQTKTLHIESVLDFFKNESSLMYYSIAIAGLVVLGFIYDIAVCGYIFHKKKHDKNTIIENRNNTEMKELSSGMVDKSNTNGKNKDHWRNGELQKMRQDISMIKENIVKINAMSKYKKTCNICSWER